MAVILMIFMLSGNSVFAMGDKPKINDKIIVESACICDAEEQTELPDFY